MKSDHILPKLQQVCLFPRQVCCVRTKMPIACSMSVKRCSQGKSVNDSRGAQVNRFKNQFLDLVCRELSRTKGVHQEGYRPGTPR